MASVRDTLRAGMLVAALIAPAPAAAQYLDDVPAAAPTVPTGPERPSDTFARYVRLIAQNPRDYQALLGAGRAALAAGDPGSAVGFFGRAADLAPSSPAPKAGMGAALAAMGEASDALAQFARAERLGAVPSSFALDRGLARDLLGQQALAQADYRLAINGRDAAEARRRLALSLAISGNRTAALAALAPLLQRSDVATNRVRAFILALGGDAIGAGRALDQSVPGLSAGLAPFFRRLPSLAPAQKAAAVHLGIIPGSATGSDSGVALAAAPIIAAPPAASPLTPPPSGILTPTARGSVIGDRLAGIDELLRQPSEAANPNAVPVFAPPPPVPSAPPTTTAAEPPAPTPTPAPKRIWIQLASGANEAALGGEFARIAARDPDLFKGIRPYVSQIAGRTKLLIGPFKNDEDSETFVANLADARINGFSWTSPEGQPVRKLTSP